MVMYPAQSVAVWPNSHREQCIMGVGNDPPPRPSPRAEQRGPLLCWGGWGVSTLSELLRNSVKAYSQDSIGEKEEVLLARLSTKRIES